MSVYYLPIQTALADERPVPYVVVVVRAKLIRTVVNQTSQTICYVNTCIEART
jgi:hypothetical protein